jgi:lipid-binding SYLF domain-containing protein
MSRLPVVIRSLVVCLVMLVGVTSSSYSQPRTPSGAIQIEILSGGFILGGSGGTGTLTYQGKQYPIGIGGLSLGLTIGVAKTELIGSVYNLTNVSDIAGT